LLDRIEELRKSLKQFVDLFIVYVFVLHHPMRGHGVTHNVNHTGYWRVPLLLVTTSLGLDRQVYFASALLHSAISATT
jgi:hypothetical protein